MLFGERLFLAERYLEGGCSSQSVISREVVPRRTLFGGRLFLAERYLEGDCSAQSVIWREVVPRRTIFGGMLFLAERYCSARNNLPSNNVLLGTTSLLITFCEEQPPSK
jgi:hypothetical protein